MTLEQIQAFIVLAEQLNYTKTSEIIFTSQPNLSRMISGIESELNIQLFIRNRREMRLSPAGVVLYKSFKHMYQQYNEGIENARLIQKGISGIIKIGILEGTDVSDFMPDMIRHFREKYPKLHIALYSYSFSELISNLFNHTLDLVITLEFNLESYSNIIYDRLEKTKDNIVITPTSKLIDKETISLEDLEGEELIIISPDDLPIIPDLVMKRFKEKNITPNYHLAPNLHTAMMWAEAGIGSVFQFSRSTLQTTSAVKFHEIDSPWSTDLVLGWHKENYNPCIPLIEDFCRNYFSGMSR